MRNTQQPWSVRVSVEDVPQAGLRVELHADAPTRVAVAKAVGVNAVDRLEAAFDLTRHGRDGLRAVGRVSAAVEQTCVVSLEPVLNEVVEDIDLTFTPRGRRHSRGLSSADMVLTAEDPPEPLIDGLVDLGAVATEFLILGIDPYPRKPGIVFEPPADPQPGSRPFAGLAALKRRSASE
jgi:hypothetical protein